MSLLRSRNLPLVAIIIGILILSGSSCTVISPSATISLANGSTEVNPNQPIKIFLSGLGARVKQLEVKVNDNPVPARLHGDGTLSINGKNKLEADTTYQISLTLTGWLGKTSSQQFVFSTVTTPRPLVSDTEQMVRFGEGIPIRWNIPIKGFRYELPAGLESRLRLDKSKRVGLIEVFNYEQGQQFEIKILDAMGLNGYRMRARNPGYMQQVATTLPIRIDVDPPEGEENVSRTAEVTLTFSEDIANTPGSEKFFSTEPVVAGTWTWTQANQIKFTPSDGWGYENKVRVRIKGGPNSLRGSSGSYLSYNFESYFLTIPRKMIDVNLSTQSLTCYDAGEPVFSCLISSGRPGYETPTGYYRIYAKDRIAVMASPPGAVEQYYVDDVPYACWVVVGVAIHGAYWHSAFGSVRSHGCINVSVSNAAWVFEWAPIGTRVHIHY